MTTQLPILYSFRRCPYAMRARMALAISNTQCVLREVVLRDKPQAMIEASPKATVPVIIDHDGRVLEESIEIMLWALEQHDPEGWLGDDTDTTTMLSLIDDTQKNFKEHLDRYKYPNRYEDIDPIEHRTEAMKFLEILNTQIDNKIYLFGRKLMLADVAIFPFVRQFANHDRNWFDGLKKIPSVQRWLQHCLELPVFAQVMDKYPQWHEGDEERVFPTP